VPSGRREQPDGQPSSKSRRQQVVGPRADFAQGDRDLAGQHRRTTPVEAEGLHLLVGLGTAEVGDQWRGRTGGGQRDVPVPLGVAHGEPAGVERQDAPEPLQDLRGTLVRGRGSARCGLSLCRFACPGASSVMAVATSRRGRTYNPSRSEQIRPTDLQRGRTGQLVAGGGAGLRRRRPGIARICSRCGATAHCTTTRVPAVCRSGQPFPSPGTSRGPVAGRAHGTSAPRARSAE
jgi:hypothetical protein